MSWDRFGWFNAWVENEALSQGQMAVLPVFMRYMSDTGRAWPSMATIASKAGMSEKVARKHLQAIVDLGYLVVVDRPGRTPIYKASIPHERLPPLEDSDPSPNVPPLEDSDPSPNVPPLEDLGRGPLEDLGRGPLEDLGRGTDQEQTNEQTRGRSSGARALEAASAAATPPPDPTSELIDLARESGFDLNPSSAGAVLARVVPRLGDEAWKYLAWKLVDLSLSETRYPSRTVFKILIADAETWAEERGRRMAGSHGAEPIAVPKSPPPEDSPSPVRLELQAELATRQLWNLALEELQQIVSPENFTSWLKPLRPLGQSDKTIVLEAQDPFGVIWVQDNYLDLIRKALNRVGVEEAAVELYACGQVVCGEVA